MAASLTTATAAAPAQVAAAPQPPAAPAAPTSMARFMQACSGYKTAWEAGFLTQAEYDMALAGAKCEHLGRD